MTIRSTKCLVCMTNSDTPTLPLMEAWKSHETFFEITCIYLNFLRSVEVVPSVACDCMLVTETERGFRSVQGN